MVAGSIIASIGAGLLTTIDVTVPTTKWAASLVITGVGVGMAFQLPYTAVQAVLEYVINIRGSRQLIVLHFEQANSS
jgi:hypothetical protein